MFLSYGPFIHDANSVGFSLDYRIKFDAFKRMRGNVQTWTIRGWVQGSTKTELTQKLVALEAAYNVPNQDLVFHEDDGTPTRHALYSASTLSGVRIVDFRYSDGHRGSGSWTMSTEYVNKRSFTVVIQADTHEDLGIIAWKESVRTIGDGGYRTVWMPSILGVPQPQIPQNFSTYQVVQSGMAVGDQSHGWPDPSPPLFGRQYLHIEESWQEHETPEFMKNGNDGYVTRWRYVFESSGVLAGVPTPYLV